MFRSCWVCSLALMIGCGSESGLAPVKGRVLMNGQPLAGAAVMFHPEGGGMPATGVTDSNGDFEMETSQVKGAAIGKNNVSVSKQVNAESNRKTEESEIVAMKSLTPPKYASPQTSGLSVDVKPGMERVELKLDAK